jgi:hypothetical protein
LPSALVSTRLVGSLGEALRWRRLGNRGACAERANDCGNDEFTHFGTYVVAAADSLTRCRVNGA